MLPRDFNEEIVSFFAYKLKSKSWCQLTLKNQQVGYTTRQALVHVLNNNTVVRLANPFEIQFHNLAEKHSWVKTIKQTGSQDRVTIDCLAASKNELYCVRNFSVYTKFSFSATTRFEKQSSILCLPSKPKWEITYITISQNTKRTHGSSLPKGGHGAT